MIYRYTGWLTTEGRGSLRHMVQKKRGGL